jgi:hypothetical protein
MQLLEQVQVRVLRRVANVDCQVPDDVLRMEFGCRSYASWLAQRKLEYSFRLRRMAEDRLPRRVAQAAWPAVGGGRHERMHAGLAQVLAVEVKLDVAAAAAVDEVTYAAFKRQVAHAVRARDMLAAQRVKRSTVGRYVRILGSPSKVPTELQDYMSGPMTTACKALLLCRADMVNTAQRLHQKQRLSSRACRRCGAACEDLVHLA